MKGLGIDIFCASQASTATCLSMDEASSSSSTMQLGGKAIDRHNPIISDTRRGGGRILPSVPCSYHPPINPKSYHQLQKTKKSSSNASKTKSTANEQAKKSSHSSKQNDQQKRKSAATTTTNSHPKLVDYIKPSSYSFTPPPSIQGDVARKSSAKEADLITPPGSTRYLLSDAAFLDGLTDYDPVLALVPLGNKKKTQLTTVKQEEESISTSNDSSSNHSKPASSDQVVVLRVSLHCRGCEGKVRKHLSRMEGVTSFNIDFAAKKVTVVGDVTPVSVLASISKVKNAQFWTASSVSSVTPANPNPNPNHTLKRQH